MNINNIYFFFIIAIVIAFIIYYIKNKHKKVNNTKNVNNTKKVNNLNYNKKIRKNITFKNLLFYFYSCNYNFRFYLLH